MSAGSGRPLHVVAHNGANLWGGAERAVARILAGLQARDHRVELLCNTPLVADEAAALGVPARLLRLGGDAAVHDAISLSGVLRRERPDVLLVGTYKKLWLAALAARLGGRVRTVARVGLETDTPRNAKYRFVFARGWVDAVVVNAAAMRPSFLGVPGLDEHAVTVIPNGVVPPPVSAPGRLREELGIPGNAPVVGAVARLAAQKRLDRLLEAVHRLPAEVHCVIAGDGPEREALREHAARLGLAGRTHFLGFRRDVGDVLDALDLFLVSSDREGMANAMLEAMAAGVPVVSTEVSGAKEALAPLGDGRRPGFVVERAEQALAGAVAGLLADPARRAEMGAAAAEAARTRFGPDAALDRWEAVLGGAA
jgi:glycosyltransferase involved in cell wall biosynthesis